MLLGFETTGALDLRAECFAPLCATARTAAITELAAHVRLAFFHWRQTGLHYLWASAIVLMPQQHGSRVDCSKSHVPVILSFRSSTWAPYMHHPQCAKRCAAKLGCFTMHARPFCFFVCFSTLYVPLFYADMYCLFFCEEEEKEEANKVLACSAQRTGRRCGATGTSGIRPGQETRLVLRS